jgi:hypothetical protein
MVQRSSRAGFLLESVQSIGVGRERRRQHLDRDVASETRIARAIHLAHSTRAERGQDFIWAEAHAGG